MHNQAFSRGYFKKQINNRKKTHITEILSTVNVGHGEYVVPKRELTISIINTKDNFKK